MIGSLHLAEQRLQELLDRYGERLALAVWEELLAHGERLMRRRIEAIPDGEYTFEDVMEGDGHTREPVTMRVRSSCAATARSSTTPAPTRRHAGRSTRPTASRSRPPATPSSR